MGYAKRKKFPVGLNKVYLTFSKGLSFLGKGKYGFSVALMVTLNALALLIYLTFWQSPEVLGKHGHFYQF